MNTPITYKEYTAMVNSVLPSMNADMLPLSPPEMLKAVAVELFMMNKIKGPLVEKTREHLTNLRVGGRTEFQEDGSMEGKIKPRGGLSDYA